MVALIFKRLSLHKLLLITHYSLLITAFAVLFSPTSIFAVTETIEVRIQSSSDDAEERNSDGDVVTNDTALELVDDVEDRGVQTVGLRFTGIDIPQGASITNAYIEFTVSATDSAATSLTIEGEAADDSVTFAASSNDISGRTPTTNSIVWNPVPAWNTVDATKQTPDLTTIVQEIIDRDGWVDNNALSFIITGSGERTAYSYDGDTAKAPLLHIELEVTADTATWPMTNSLNYTYDTEKIEFVEGYAQVKQSSGDILNNIIDTYLYNNDKSKRPDIIHVSGDIYAVAYTGPDFDGFIKTIEIAPNGIITKSIIDILEFDTNKAKKIRILHISGNIFAVNYQDYHSSKVRTVEILPDGQITDTFIDSLDFDDQEARSEPVMVHVSGDIYAIAYTGYGSGVDEDHGDDGQLVTVEININGQITNSVIDNYEFESVWAQHPTIVHATGNIFAIAYEGKDDQGRVITVEIATNGQITKSVIDALAYSPSSTDPHLIAIANDYYALVFRKRTSYARGTLMTIEILSNGQITDTPVDTFEFEKERLNDPEILHVFQNMYIIAYDGIGENGYTIAIEINQQTGLITKQVTDKLVFSTNRGSKHLNLIKINNSVIAVVYEESPGDSGYVKTIGISMGYQADGPSLRPRTADSVKFYTLYGFITTEDTDGGTVRYQLTNDGYNPSPTWYYWDGANWATAIVDTDYNDATTINNNIYQFVEDIGRGNFSFRAFLNSNGSQFVRLDNVDLNYGYVQSTALSATITNFFRHYENQNNKVRIDYILSDSGSASCNYTIDTTQVQYTNSLFGPWSDGTVTGFTDNLTSSPTGTIHDDFSQPLVWDATGVPDGDYYLRIKPHNGSKYAPKYDTSTFTVKIYTPTPGDIMRHGQSFLEEVKQYFYFDGFNE